MTEVTKVMELEHYIDVHMSSRDYLIQTGGCEKKIKKFNSEMIDAVMYARQAGWIDSNQYEEYLNLILE